MTDLRALLGSDHVSPATRGALAPRLEESGWPDPPVFTDDERRTLAAIVDHVIPEVDGIPRPDLVKAYEYRISAPEGKGWRYESLPDAVTAARLLIRLLDAASDDVCGQRFRDLGAVDQVAILNWVQPGDLTPPDADLDAPRAFEDMLAMLVECYATDPAVLVAIGYVGFADLPRWEHVGLDERDDREPPTPSSVTDG